MPAAILIGPLAIGTAGDEQMAAGVPGIHAVADPGGAWASGRRPGLACRDEPQLFGVPHAPVQPNDGCMTTIEQNKAIICEFIDRLFTKGDLGAVDDLLAEDFVNHDPPFGAPADREGMRGAAAMFRAAFPDWHSDLGLLIGEGDLVVEQFTASGTQRGEIMGVPASGRTVTLPGIQIFRVRDGRIVERWGRLDDLGLLSQLGLVNQP
jgi:steroid delta-isomerase-like uncharacterized protein